MEREVGRERYEEREVRQDMERERDEGREIGREMEEGMYNNSTNVFLKYLRHCVQEIALPYCSRQTTIFRTV